MTFIAIDRTAPFYDPRGWVQWPGNEEFSFQFMRVLGAAQDGGSTVSECLLAASGIDPNHEESWYRQWKKAADVNKARGDIAVTRRHVKTALSNWLRAANYYRTAQVFMPASDPRRRAALAQMVACSQLYLKHATPAGEVVEIEWAGDRSLQGYFLPAPGRARRPVVLCVGAPDQFKEEHLYRMPRYAHERGLSLLLVDLPGQNLGRRDQRPFGRYDLETSISSWIDYLIDRGDVDPRKIAIFGDGIGASFATRGAAFDDRLAAAVCDAGIWELHERAFLASRLSGGAVGADLAGEDIDDLCRSSIARRIKCPILVAIGEHDWLDAGHVTRCCAALVQSGVDIDLKIFSAAETAASHAQLDNPTIGSEFIFDWIADHLGRKR
ncbi:MAG: alpha/beta hydrolase [Tardiphaga sp.]